MQFSVDSTPLKQGICRPPGLVSCLRLSERGAYNAAHQPEDGRPSCSKNMESGPEALLSRLRSGELLISDGATGTFLQQHGLEPGGCPEEFNASHPEVVRDMARQYFEAGSDLVLTNSFGGTVFMQKKYGHGERVEEFNRLAAEHARSQAPQGGFVVGSVGPTGEFPGNRWGPVFR